MEVTQKTTVEEEQESQLRAWQKYRSTAPSTKGKSLGHFEVTSDPQTIQPQGSTRSTQQRSKMGYTAEADEWSKLIRIGVGHHAKGDYPAALLCFQDALKLQVERLGKKHLTVAHTLANIGAVLLRQGRLDLAEDALEMSLQVKEEIKADANIPIDEENEILLSDVLNNLGNLAYLRGNHMMSLEWYYRSIQDLESRSSRDEQMANALHNVGRIHVITQNWDEALQVLNECVQLEEELYGNENGEIADTMELLGYVHLSQKSFDKAMVAFSDALSIHQNNLGAVHENVGTALVNVAMVMEGQGNLKHACKTYATAREVFKKLGVREEHRGFHAASRSYENLKARIRSGKRRSTKKERSTFIPINEEPESDERECPTQGSMRPYQSYDLRD